MVYAPEGLNPSVLQPGRAWEPRVNIRPQLVGTRQSVYIGCYGAWCLSFGQGVHAAAFGRFTDLSEQAVSGLRALTCRFPANPMSTVPGIFLWNVPSPSRLESREIRDSSAARDFFVPKLSHFVLEVRAMGIGHQSV
ncbi:hypothetical protein CC2G_013718 [Coprinopsis cinerea AmutBmut pab1-1]|nr:hypothetical protein CC2G_013718 [Coprinopsis cinerea AmutBmut pab1-1]